MIKNIKKPISAILVASIMFSNISPAFAQNFHVKVGDKVRLKTAVGFDAGNLTKLSEIEKMMDSIAETYGSASTKVSDNNGQVINNLDSKDPNLASLIDKLTGGKKSTVLTKEEWDALIKSQTGMAYEEYLKKQKGAKIKALKGNKETAEKIKQMVKDHALGKGSGNTPGTNPQSGGNGTSATQNPQGGGDQVSEFLDNAINETLALLLQAYGVDEDGNMYLKSKTRTDTVNEYLKNSNYDGLEQMFGESLDAEEYNSTENDEPHIDTEEYGLDAFYSICSRCGGSYSFNYSNCTCRYKKFYDKSMIELYENNTGNTDFLPHFHRHQHKKQVTKNGTIAVKDAAVARDAEGNLYVGKAPKNTPNDDLDGEVAAINPIKDAGTGEEIDFLEAFLNSKKTDNELLVASNGNLYYKSSFEEKFKKNGTGDAYVATGREVKIGKPVDARDEILHRYGLDSLEVFDFRKIKNEDERDTLLDEAEKMRDFKIKTAKREGNEQKEKDAATEYESTCAYINETYEKESKEIAENGTLREDTMLGNMRSEVETIYERDKAEAANDPAKLAKIESWRKESLDKIDTLEANMVEAQSNKSSTSILGQYTKEAKRANDEYLTDYTVLTNVTEEQIESAKNENGGRNATAYKLQYESERKDAFQKAIDEAIQENPELAKYESALKGYGPDDSDYYGQIPEFMETAAYKNYRIRETGITNKYDKNQEYLKTRYAINGNWAREMEYAENVGEQERKDLIDAYYEVHPEERQTDENGKTIYPESWDLGVLSDFARGDMDFASKMNDIYAKYRDGSNVISGENDTSVYAQNVAISANIVMKDILAERYGDEFEAQNTTDYALEYLKDCDSYENDVNQTTLTSGENVKVAKFFSVRVYDMHNNNMNINDILNGIKNLIAEGFDITGLTLEQIMAIIREMMDKDPYDGKVGGESIRESLAGKASEYATSPEYQSAESQAFSKPEKSWDEILAELLEKLKDEFGYHYDENGNLIFTDETMRELYEQGLLDGTESAQDIIDKINEYIASFSSIEDLLRVEMVTNTVQGESKKVSETYNVYDGVDVVIREAGSGNVVAAQTYMANGQQYHWSPWTPGTYIADSIVYWWVYQPAYREIHEITTVNIPGVENHLTIERIKIQADYNGYNAAEKHELKFNTDNIKVDPRLFATDIKDYPDIEQIL